MKINSKSIYLKVVEQKKDTIKIFWRGENRLQNDYCFKLTAFSTFILYCLIKKPRFQVV